MSDTTDRTKPPPGWEAIRRTDERGVTYGRESYWRESLEIAWDVYDRESYAARREGYEAALAEAEEMFRRCGDVPLGASFRGGALHGASIHNVAEWARRSVASVREYTGEHVGAAKKSK